VTEPRFDLGGDAQRVGIVDRQGGKFAEFHPAGAGKVFGYDEGRWLRWRLDRAIARLNSGEDTPTGYVWEKMSQGGTQREEERA